MFGEFTMKIKKVETNFNKNLFFNTTENIEVTKDLENTEKQLINIHPEITYQEILGFGGAFTEASGYAVSKVDENIRDNILNEYFSEDGLGYTLCRTHIGSCDFSTKSYSYLYDENIDNFSIKEDENYLIPMIKDSLKINRNIKLLASPWSPPSFMKDNNNLFYGGKLLKKYYPLWAKYLVRYIEEYIKHGIKIDYMTLQNEPNASQIWESCIYSADEEADLLCNYISPHFKQKNLNTKFLIWDHNKERLYDRAKRSISLDKENTVSGIAFHWYSGDYFEEVRAS